MKFNINYYFYIKIQIAIKFITTLIIFAIYNLTHPPLLSYQHNFLKNLFN